MDQRKVGVLLELFQLSGSPSYTDIARQSELTGQAISDQTVANLLAGKSSPRERSVATFIAACLYHLIRRSDLDLPEEIKSSDYWQARYRQALPTGELSQSSEEDGVKRRQLVAIEPAVEFVGRNEAVQSIRSLIDNSQAHIVVLGGDSGNGKSRLMYEILQALFKGGYEATYLFNAESEATLTESVIGRLGDQFDSVTPTEVLPRLLLRLRSEKARGKVVVGLDDAVSYSLSKRFLDVADVVLITAFEDVIPPDVQHTYVKIDPLTPEAGVALIKKLMPGVGDRDALRILHFTGGKPRVIIDCLGVFSPLGMSVDALCSQLALSPRALLNSVSRSDRSVTHAYEAFADELAEQDRRAYDLLAVISILAFRPVAKDVLRCTFRQLGVYEQCHIADGEFERCLYIISTRLNLDLWDDRFVQVNRLTYGVFQEIFESRRKAVSFAAVIAYNTLPIEKVHSKYELTRLPWIWCLADAVYNYGRDLEQDSPKEYEETLLAVCTGLNALGDLGALEVFLRHLSALEGAGKLTLPASVAHWIEGFKYLTGWTSRSDYMNFLLANQEEAKSLFGPVEASATFYQLSYEHSLRVEALSTYASVVSEARLLSTTFDTFVRTMISSADSRAWMGDLPRADLLWQNLLESVMAFADQDYGARWSSAVNVAADAIKYHSQAFDLVKSDRWWTRLRDHYQKALESEGARPSLTSRLLTGQSWILRCRTIINQSDAGEPINSFIQSAALHQAHRHVREWLSDMVEASNLLVWARLQNHVDPAVVDRFAQLIRDRSDLVDYAKNLGESHLSFLLRLADLVAHTTTNGPTEAVFDLATRAAFRVALAYEHARLFRLACALAHVNAPAVAGQTRLKRDIEKAFTESMAGLGQLWSVHDLDNLARHGTYPSGLLWM